VNALGGEEAFQDALLIGRRLEGHLTRPAAAALRFATSLADERLSDEFWVSFIDQEYPKGFSPLKASVQAIMKDQFREKRKQIYNTQHRMMLLIKAWNAIRKGKVVKVMRLVADESFPMIDGLDTSSKGPFSIFLTK
jgi:hypothetical protein